MSFAYDPVTKEAELQCFRGTCVLENDLGTQVLVDEQKSTATAETAPEEPLVMTVEETLVFEELPEAKTGEVIIPTPEPPAPTPAPTETPQPTTPAPSPTPVATIAPEPTIAPTLPPPTAAPVPTARVPRQVETEEDPEVVVEPATPAPRPESTPVPTVSRVPTPVPTPTVRPSPTPRPTIRVTPTPTVLPTLTQTPAPTPVPSPTAAAPLDVPLPPPNPSALPHIFVGTAFVDGQPAPEGAEISAWLDGFSEPLAQTIVSSNAFTILVPEYGAGIMAGRDIEFRLDGLIVEPRHVWVPGGADVVVLNRFSESGS